MSRHSNVIIPNRGIGSRLMDAVRGAIDTGAKMIGGAIVGTTKDRQRKTKKAIDDQASLKRKPTLRG